MELRSTSAHEKRLQHGRQIFRDVIVVACRFAAVIVCALFVGAGAADSQEIDRVLVKKALRKLELLSGERVIKTYSVALGREPEGAKQRQGDGKTPEGEYTISGRNPRSAYHRSLRVSYPNAADRKRAARMGVSPGGDIMIHGLPPSYLGPQGLHTAVDWTEGCIAVTDAEIEEIWKLVKNGTKVTIVP